jgi:hypothetical protein
VPRRWRRGAAGEECHDGGGVECHDDDEPRWRQRGVSQRRVTTAPVRSATTTNHDGASEECHDGVPRQRRRGVPRRRATTAPARSAPTACHDAAEEECHNLYGRFLCSRRTDGSLTVVELMETPQAGWPSLKARRWFPRSGGRGSGGRRFAACHDHSRRW